MVATAANRANARRSSGPRIPEGKAASSRNALTHDVHATTVARGQAGFVLSPRR